MFPPQTAFLPFSRFSHLTSVPNKETRRYTDQATCYMCSKERHLREGSKSSSSSFEFEFELARSPPKIFFHVSVE